MSIVPRKGARNETPPMSRLSLNLARITSRSTSAPARNVKRMPPKPAIYVTQGRAVTPKKFPASTPSAISIIDAEIPSSTESTLERKIKPASTVPTYSSCTPTDLLSKD
jgi:hypothetical protein